MNDVSIRDAATVIIVRDAGGPAPSVLMGQRGAAAAFMPSKTVFPGGAVDNTDAGIPVDGVLEPTCLAQLRQHSALDPMTLATAAIRELWEETGLVLGARADWSDAPADWVAFAASGYRPRVTDLRFVFRAITPPGRPRRFDARFFLCDASALSGDLDDFSRASDELSHLQWIPLRRAREFDLPFITEIVLAEIASRLPSLAPPAEVPFFRNNDEELLFERLRS